MGKLNGTEVHIHRPSVNEVQHADVLTPLPNINGSAQMRINEQGEVIDTRVHIKGGFKTDF